MGKSLPFFFLLILACQNLFAQADLNTELSFQCKRCLLPELLTDLEKKNVIRFFYKEEWFRKARVDFPEKAVSLHTFLAILKKSYGIQSIFREPGYVVFLKPEMAADLPPNMQAVVIGGDVAAMPFEEVELQGIVRDADSREPVAGATIYVQELETGTVTDAEGQYVLRLLPGNYRIGFNAANLSKMEFDFVIRNSGRFDVELAEDVTLLKEVMVSAERERDILNSSLGGVSTLSPGEIKKAPAFLGEVDVVRAVLSLPGVGSVGEGSAGFNVRGGMTGENLILMDGMPIYNSAHMAGFFSTFNPDIVEEVNLYRGGVPAQFGGRSAAYLDVKVREGNNEKISGSGGAGLLASRLSVDGPIVKGKSTFLLGFRAAYPNYILGRLKDVRVKKSRAFFYDANAKVQQTFKDGGKLAFTAYSSYDNIDFAGETFYEFGNTNGHLEYKRLFGEYTMFKTSLINSHYAYSVEEGELDRGYRMNAFTNDARFNAEFSYFKFKDHALSAGFQNTYLTLNSGNLTPSEGASLTPVRVMDEHGLESALFIQDKITFSSNLVVDAGLRFSMFGRLGPAQLPEYAAEADRTLSSVQDTLSFSAGEIIKTYHGLEPRLSVLYKVGPKQSLKGGYHRMYQYIHLISNTTAVTPIDTWKLSNGYILPNYSDQFSAGYFTSFQDNAFEASLEVYYKMMHNVLDYKDGASLYMNKQIETELLQGEGRGYGMELLLKKNSGKLNGWLAYTWSRAELIFEGPSSSTRINRGNYFPANFDRPHDLKLFVNGQVTHRLSVSGNFVYATGRPVTYPESTYYVGGISVANYSLRNQYRIPDTHRLDLAVTVDGNLRRKKNMEASWTFSVYNLYGRRNPYSVFFRPDTMGNINGYKLSVIGRPFFSVTYNFKF